MRYKENDPELMIVARRLDVVAPLVWGERANATMLTGVNYPAPGCLEIGARYSDPNGRVEMLNYVVLLKP